MTHWKRLLEQGYSFPEISTRLFGDGPASPEFTAAWRAHESRRRTNLKHYWDERDVCIRCNITYRECIDEFWPSCRKPRFGEGAPAGFGAPNFVGPRLDIE